MSATVNKKQPFSRLEKLPGAPTQPGIYWFKGNVAFYEVMVDVRITNGELMVWWLTREDEPVANLKGRWCGPIPPSTGPGSR
jgi:hypothetical protein